MIAKLVLRHAGESFMNSGAGEAGGAIRAEQVKSLNSQGIERFK